MGSKICCVLGCEAINHAKCYCSKHCGALPENRALARERQRRDGGIHKQACIKYEKTMKGYLMRAYRNAQSRVTGVQSKKAHLYKNLTIIPRDEFYMWSFFDPAFVSLFLAYCDSGCSMRCAPSLDRIDVSKGYEHGNIQWITHSENSRLGALSKKTSIKNGPRFIAINAIQR